MSWIKLLKMLSLNVYYFEIVTYFS